MKPTSATDSVKFYFFADSLSRLAGCAYSAISLLTGEDPNYLRKKYKDEPGMPPKTILRHFKKLGFKITELNQKYIYNLIYKGLYVTDNHVVLASVRMNKKEASWVIFYGGMMWHNFTPLATTYISSMSYPMEHAYMLYLPEWRGCAIAEVQGRRARAMKTLRKSYALPAK